MNCFDDNYILMPKDTFDGLLKYYISLNKKLDTVDYIVYSVLENLLIESKHGNVKRTSGADKIYIEIQFEFVPSIFNRPVRHRSKSNTILSSEETNMFSAAVDKLREYGIEYFTDSSNNMYFRKYLNQV